MSAGDSIYTGLSDVGKAKSAIGLIFGIIISIILIAVAIYLFTKNQKDIVNSTAKVTSSTCSQSGKSISCQLGIAYTVDKKDYTGSISTLTSTKYTTGMDVPISYNSKNPLDVTYKQVNDKTVAFILLGVAVLLLLITSVSYYMTSRSKAYAAFEGAEGIAKIL